ncbi:MAG: hypothetical protein K5705_13835 [Oscillospiraceae bacterium]|nr:hypothetical protein [Oscillospiraceae bacterium]
MKEQTGKQRIKRIVAAVCAVLIVGSGTAGALAFRSRAGNQPEAAQRNTRSLSASAAGSETISAGGTVESEQFGDDLGLVNTGVRLTVEAVLAEAGDTVTAGTQLYQITEDSLAKAEKTLRSELQSAENALIEQKVSYQEEQGKATVLCESEQQLGKSAQQTYESGITALETSLEQAYSDYMDALDTISNLPSEIAAKQSELDAKQADAEQMQEEQKAAKADAGQAEDGYRSAAAQYNSTAAEYNAAAGVVRYLGNALGKDVSGISLAENVNAALQAAQSNAEPASAPDREAPDTAASADRPDMQDFGFISKSTFQSAAVNTAESLPDKTGTNDSLTQLYDAAYAEYEAQKTRLADAESAFRNAESEYQRCTESQSACEAALKEAQSRISSLEKEISSLNSTLSKAKTNLSKLRSEYNSLKASYETDRLDLKHTLETDTAAGENAEYHYEITCATIEDELAEAQAAYDTAEENLRIFEENLADGYVCAKQDGIIYSLNCQEGRSVNLNTSYVSYVDESSYYTTVELDQNDVTQVSIGDSVLIYTSETGTANGKVTAIAAGESASLADVRFNVTVTADENAELYSGESVNVYFNAGNLKQSDFRDFDGGGDSERKKPSSDGERPDFSGRMPEGFDPSNMPDFGRRKDD